MYVQISCYLHIAYVHIRGYLHIPYVHKRDTAYNIYKIRSYLYIPCVQLRVNLYIFWIIPLRYALIFFLDIVLLCTKSSRYYNFVHIKIFCCSYMHIILGAFGVLNSESQFRQNCFTTFLITFSFLNIFDGTGLKWKIEQFRT